ncbi:MAG: tetratricopeptide repeat protein [candidate division Zixibacteria bacterium]|nr:tetratricopeptide repeat protein [candidate division Zixibacteria bacterium]
MITSDEVNLAESIFTEAHKLYQSERFKESLDILESNVDMLSDHYGKEEIDRWVGGSYYYMADHAKAVKHLENSYIKVQALSNENKIAHEFLILVTHLAVSYFELKKYSEALRYFDEGEALFALFKDSEHCFTRYTLRLYRSRCLRILERYKEAHKILKKALKEISSATCDKIVGSDRACLLIDLAIVSKHLNKLRRAGKYIELINLSDLHELQVAEYAFTKMLIDVSREKFERAAQCFQEYRESIDRSNYKAEAYCLMGVAQYCLSQPKSAEEYFRRSQEMKFTLSWVREYNEHYLNEISKES